MGRRALEDAKILSASSSALRPAPCALTLQFRQREDFLRRL